MDQAGWQHFVYTSTEILTSQMDHVYNNEVSQHMQSRIEIICECFNNRSHGMPFKSMDQLLFTKHIYQNANFYKKTTTRYCFVQWVNGPNWCINIAGQLLTPGDYPLS